MYSILFPPVVVASFVFVLGVICVLFGISLKKQTLKKVLMYVIGFILMAYALLLFFAVFPLVSGSAPV
jgi:sulfite exporter TauE/SafE